MKKLKIISIYSHILSNNSPNDATNNAISLFKDRHKVDKIMVAKKHIIPEILENIGFSDKDIIMGDTELMYIIDTYTYEAGARKLKEKLYEIYREINLKYLMNYDSFFNSRESSSLGISILKRQ